MNKYLKDFETHSDYVTFTQSANYIKPNVSICEQEDDVHYSEHDYSEDYLTFRALEDGTFKIIDTTNSFNYSLDNGATWISLAANTDTPTVTAGSKILWKASNLTIDGTNGIGNFVSTGSYNVEGNIMSLLYGDYFRNETTLTEDYQFAGLFYEGKIVNAKKLVLPATTLSTYCYRSLFNGCYSLVEAPVLLPAVTLKSYCYQNMFAGCTSLRTAPELLATTMATYACTYMFSSCTSLTIAPVLSATTLADYCYDHMFSDCTSLMIALKLPATTLATYCYQYMFSRCRSLITAPELPATTLANYCYFKMFYGCISLTTAPVLSATTLVNSCYRSMFENCTSLTTAPELPATTLKLNCYQSMFDGCTNLNYIKAMFTETPSISYTASWVRNVAASGTFVKNSAATWTTTGDEGVPTGWTIQTASA